MNMEKMVDAAIPKGTGANIAFKISEAPLNNPFIFEGDLVMVSCNARLNAYDRVVAMYKNKMFLAIMDNRNPSTRTFQPINGGKPILSPDVDGVIPSVMIIGKVVGIIPSGSYAEFEQEATRSVVQ